MTVRGEWVTKEELLQMAEQEIMIQYIFLDKIFEVKNAMGAFR